MIPGEPFIPSTITIPLWWFVILTLVAMATLMIAFHRLVHDAFDYFENRRARRRGAKPYTDPIGTRILPEHVTGAIAEEAKVDGPMGPLTRAASWAARVHIMKRELEEAEAKGSKRKIRRARLRLQLVTAAAHTQFPDDPRFMNPTPGDPTVPGKDGIRRHAIAKPTHDPMDDMRIPARGMIPSGPYVLDLTPAGFDALTYLTLRQLSDQEMRDVRVALIASFGSKDQALRTAAVNALSRWSDVMRERQVVPGTWFENPHIHKTPTIGSLPEAPIIRTYLPGESVEELNAWGPAEIAMLDTFQLTVARRIFRAALLKVEDHKKAEALANALTRIGNALRLRQASNMPTIEDLNELTRESLRLMSTEELRVLGEQLGDIVRTLNRQGEVPHWHAADDALSRVSEVMSEREPTPIKPVVQKRLTAISLDTLTREELSAYPTADLRLFKHQLDDLESDVWDIEPMERASEMVEPMRRVRGYIEGILDARGE